MFLFEVARNFEKEIALLDPECAKEFLLICRLLICQGARTNIHVRNLSLL